MSLLCTLFVKTFNCNIVVIKFSKFRFIWVCFGYLKVSAMLNFMTKIGLRLGMSVNTTPGAYYSA